MQTGAPQQSLHLIKDDLDRFINLGSEWKLDNASFLPVGQSMVRLRVSSDGHMHWPKKFPVAVSSAFISMYCRSENTAMQDDDPQYLLQWIDRLGCTDAHIWLLLQM